MIAEVLAALARRVLNMRARSYRGWVIYRGPDHPVTGKWRARRWGVTIGHSDLAGLIKMIHERGY